MANYDFFGDVLRFFWDLWGTSGPRFSAHEHQGTGSGSEQKIDCTFLMIWYSIERTVISFHAAISGCTSPLPYTLPLEKRFCSRYTRTIDVRTYTDCTHADSGILLFWSKTNKCCEAECVRTCIIVNVIHYFL